MLRAAPPGHPLQKPTVVQWDIGAMLSADGAADESVSPQSGITQRCRTPLHDRTQPGMRFRRYFPRPHDGGCAHCGLVRQPLFSLGLLLEYSKPAAAGG